MSSDNNLQINFGFIATFMHGLSIDTIKRLFLLHFYVDFAGS